jgi:TolB protein
LIAFVSILSFGLPDALSAQTEIWTKITATPGSASLALALAQLGFPSGADSGLAEAAPAIRGVLHRDLANSLFIRVVQPESGKSYSSEPSSLDFPGWAATGASVLVAGDLTDRSLSIRLYDLISKRLVATKDYSRTGNDRLLGHHVADEIIKLLTGEEGVSTTRIVFSRRGNGSRELYTVDQDGLDPRQLTAGGRICVSPDWSPDGDRIAYSTYHDDKLIIAGHRLSKGASYLICDRADMNDTPAWSPDGSLIAAALSTESGMEIFVMDGSGQNLRPVTRNGGINTSPTWSPNGKQLAFVSDRAGGPQIYVINIDGTDQQRLTFEGSYNTTPAWSPRGDLIAFSRRDGSRNQICITDLNGETIKQTTWSGDNFEPCFSPDGLHLVFVSDRDGGADLYVMSWDGADQRRLTAIGGCSAPAWSPPLNR